MTISEAKDVTLVPKKVEDRKDLQEAVESKEEVTVNL